MGRHVAPSSYNTYAFGAIGQDNTSAGGSNIVQMAGGFGLNANGTVSGDRALNDLYFHFGSQITDGTYTVDPTGSQKTLNQETLNTDKPSNGTTISIEFLRIAFG
jgi:hypothetical protein